MGWVLLVLGASMAPARAGGLVAVPFRAVNLGSAPILCSATLAHWYSAELGRAAKGEAISATFWSDTATGAVYLLNQSGHPMPVAQLWCGVAGREAGRSLVTLERRAGVVQGPLLLVCKQGNAGLVCLAGKGG